uniref:Uncharacterized protein n=1 Tax=Arion vulgaris TaxID=1028688 RepID=A0A0B7A548_9EUPU
MKHRQMPVLDISSYSDAIKQNRIREMKKMKSYATGAFVAIIPLSSSGDVPAGAGDHGSLKLTVTSVGSQVIC